MQKNPSFIQNCLMEPRLNGVEKLIIRKLSMKTCRCMGKISKLGDLTEASWKATGSMGYSPDQELLLINMEMYTEAIGE